MKVFDIVLAVIRGVLVMDLIREVWVMAFGLFNVAMLTWNSPLPAATRPLQFTTWVGSVGSIVGSLIILAASRPIARFASKLADASDTATTF
jgi:hypothetical protein